MENTPSAESATATHHHRGSCHCGAVRFEANVNVFEGASKCNCSICLKVGGIGAVTKPEAFTLLQGEGSLSEYAWGGKTATRYFCKHCGIHCFGRGHLAELGGDYVSLNVNALDDVDPSTLTLVHWDGRHNNWHAGPRSEPWPVFSTASATSER